MILKVEKFLTFDELMNWKLHEKKRSDQRIGKHGLHFYTLDLYSAGVQ